MRSVIGLSALVSIRALVGFWRLCQTGDHRHRYSALVESVSNVARPLPGGWANTINQRALFAPSKRCEAIEIQYPRRVCLILAFRARSESV